MVLKDLKANHEVFKKCDKCEFETNIRISNNCHNCGEKLK